MASNSDKKAKPEAGENHHNGNSFVYIGTIVLLIITVLAFVLVPAMGSMGNTDNSLTFGSYDGKPISFVQGGYFTTQVQQIKAQLESQGYKDSGDQFFAFQVWRRAFENTAVHLGLLDLSQKAGISVSDEYLDRKMIENQAFLENGVFSKRKYREASNSFKLSLRKEIGQSTLKERYVSDTVGFIPSEAETEFLKAMAQSQRVIEFVAIPFSAYPDSERLAWAKANPAAFRRVRLSKVTVSSSRKEAEQVLAKVQSGELSFEEAAKNHSKDSYAAKGGDMGSRYLWELKGELKNESDLDAVVAAPKGELSAVYDTIAGSWSFYRVEEAATEADFASADLLKTVTAYLERNEKGRLEDYAVASAAAFRTAASANFGSAATSAGYLVKETKPFPLNFGKALDIGYFSLLGSLDTTDLPELKDADKDERFLQAVFSLKAGELSAPVILNDQAIVARVKEIKNADDGEMGLLAAYYPTVVQQGVSSELASSILASPGLKDDFMATFTRAYAQTN